MTTKWVIHMTVKEAFDQFDDNLKLDPDERQAAIDVHHEMRDVLKEAGACGTAILQGSFARKTMLAPLRDIDMVGFLNEEHRHLMEEVGGVAKAMELIDQAILDHFPGVVTEWSRHAVKITFPGWDFTFDLVPAFDRDDSSLIDIANYDDDTWDESNTRDLIRKVSDRNQTCDGRFVHQVRMLKHWSRNILDGIPGLYVESAAYDGITASMEHPEAVVAALRQLEESLDSGEQYDPTGADNLHQRLESGAADAALPEVTEARGKAEEALALADDDEDAAINVWYDIFDEPFPEPPAQSVEEAFTNSLTGGLTTSGVATSSKNARVSTPPVRSWRSA